MTRSASDLNKEFAKARRLFPHTGKIIYFNSASYGPFCRPVADAIKDNLQLRMSANRDDSHDAFDTADELRRDFAAMIGARKRDVGIGLNTSFGLNIAAYGLPLKAGDEVLLSDVEFPAAVYTWRAAAEARDLKLKFVPSTNRFFDIDKFEESITSKSRVLVLSFVQFFNGFKNDLKKISEICKRRKLFLVVDGIQGAGVEPINVRRLGIDIFSSGCQKWLLSPQGCGFFYLSERIQQKLKPPFMSWLGADWKLKFTELFDYNRPFFDSARRFEMGYYAVLNLLGMKAALGLFKNLGVAGIQRHNHALIDRLAEYVKDSEFYRITSSMENVHRSSIFTFTCPNLKLLHRMLLDHKIILVRREGSIRVSVHLFNNDRDMNHLLEIIDEFARR